MPTQWKMAWWRNSTFSLCGNNGAEIALIEKSLQTPIFWRAFLHEEDGPNRLGDFRTLKEAKLAIEKKLGIKRIKVISYEDRSIY
jgi:hypothetical protein